MKVEADWMTKAGFRAAVIMTSMGHRCGYVGIPKDHPLHGLEYTEQTKHLRFPGDESIGERGIIPLLCASVRDTNEGTSPDVAFDVHGGLTYSGGGNNYPVPSEGLWWFGYDCAHAGDAKDPEYVSDWDKKHPEYRNIWNEDGAVFRSLEFCVDQCEGLAEQLTTRIVAPTP